MCYVADLNICLHRFSHLLLEFSDLLNLCAHQSFEFLICSGAELAQLAQGTQT